ncbi:MAG: dTMP kinase [Phycisphaerales bacterium]|nr:dTMP kinase [Planctomycetota bacterium]MCH8509799.1 dTMP kinase [Phycisphaerales bacterium]
MPAQTTAVTTTPRQADTIPPALAKALRGKFLVFDGPDGSGKSTQHKRFVAAARAAGIETIEVREPGGTEVGERIRRALLDHLERDEMSLRCEMLLYMASRAQLCERVIGPALKQNKLVVADRFISSTLVYQGHAGGIPAAEIEAAGRIATQGVTPDATLIFDIDQQTAASRLNPLLDRMESKGEDFHAKVRAGYKTLIARGGAYQPVDARGAPDEVFANILQILTAELKST